MVQAEAVFSKAIAIRDSYLMHAKSTPANKSSEKHPDDFNALRDVVNEWVKERAQQDPKKRIKAFVELLETSRSLREELALQLRWSAPREVSMDLILLAFEAIRRGKDAPVRNIFDQTFPDKRNFDWETWKETHDISELRNKLDNNPDLRNKLSQTLDEYPNRRYLEELATEVGDLLPFLATPATVPSARQGTFAVLYKHVLNWETFATGGREQELHLMAILQKDYGFRHAVARAVREPGSESEELAHLAVEMWRALPLSRRISLCGCNKKDADARIPEEFRANPDNELSEDKWGRVKNQLAVTFAASPRKADDLWDAMEWPQPFALVLREELRQIQARRNHKPTPATGASLAEALAARGNPARNGPPPPSLGIAGPDDASDASDLAVEMKLFGIAFSGGGIRSATFNLGVLQGLSKFGLLSEADYLSTVSGGGYIGSWLTGWIYKNRSADPSALRDGLENLLSPKVPDPRADALRPLRFLREFSNYLTPQLGSFSFDTWTMSAVYSRNLFLNQATLITVLGFLLLIPRFMTFTLTWSIPDWWMGLLAVLLVGAAVCSISVNIRGAVDPDSAAKQGLSAWARNHLHRRILRVAALRRGVSAWARNHVQLSAIACFLSAMYLGSLWIWRNETFLDEYPVAVPLCALAIASFLSFLLLWQGGFIREFKMRQVGSGWWGAVLLLIVSLSAGAMTGLLIAYLRVMQWLHQLDNLGKWNAVIWSPVMLLAVIMIPGTLQVGLMGVDFPDAGREWLSRFRAICTVYSVWWIAFLGAAIYGPLLIWYMVAVTGKWASGITVGWVATTIAGILAGKSKETGTDKEGAPKVSRLQFLAKLAPPVFAVGLVLLIATGEQALLAHGTWASCEPVNTDSLLHAGWFTLDRHNLFDLRSWYVDQPGWLLLALLAAGTILSWRVDINEFSMHHFYKNRLVRCYLGASNENRRPNEFTGFDARDDVRLALLKAIPSDVNGKKEALPYLGPYPIINTTLNLAAGKQLAWQERKGASFILSPCFCGFDVQGWASTNASRRKPSVVVERSPKLSPAGYRKTASYTHKNGPFLGTSFSISGAAASPNQGYNTSPAVAFLMTMFDVRLGWWVGNPRKKNVWKWASPAFGLHALFSELMGLTDDEARFVNLSDGGHFDNMGLYELVRRRCSFILLCDAEQDANFKFEGLGSAIRKCRIDFGACIEIDTSLIRPGKDGMHSGTHCAVGTIVYLDGSEGTLVYIKPSLTGDEPEDVIQYHRAHAGFPHESTADQWFSESQFESYRALGLHATEESLKGAGAWIKWNPEEPNVCKLVEALSNYWYPNNPNLKENASRNTATLVKMFDTIRDTRELRDLGSKLFPGITVPPPANDQSTKEFYFGLALLQLVEDIYFDFKLDRDVWAKDPRIGGWNYLFRTWKRVPEVALAWASTRDTFRKDFQIFWDEM